jgi:hypothetical protein
MRFTLCLLMPMRVRVGMEYVSSGANSLYFQPMDIPDVQVEQTCSGINFRQFKLSSLGLKSKISQSMAACRFNYEILSDKHSVH